MNENLPLYGHCCHFAMHARLQIGEASPLLLAVRDEARIRLQIGEAGNRLFDVAGDTMRALASPDGFPPLELALVPSDRVVIALGDGVRQGADVVRGIASALDAASVPVNQLGVLVATLAEADTLGRHLADLVSQGLQIEVHDPRDPERLVFVAAFEGQPLRINRLLGEADFIITVACARHPEGLDSRGPFEAIFPRFSDVEAISSQLQEIETDSCRRNGRRRERTARAGWLLGANLVIEVVPAREGGVAAILAGEPVEVERRADELFDREWRVSVERPANLVVVSLGGGATEQSWTNVARALHAARGVVDETQSAIALCTELQEVPGPALKRLEGFRDESIGYANLDTDDAAVAWELYQALERGPVYLMSRLPPATVEELGMAPLEDHGQLARLLERSGSCLILNDGQYAIPQIEQESAAFRGPLST